MSRKKNIIVLTSRDNFVWTSMQEIIPLIESTWQSLCVKYDYQYQIINVDESSPSNKLKELISSDLIVVTCFNTKIARFIEIARGKLQIDTRMCFYLHGLATIALWPLHRFNILNLMNSDDLFIGTCEGDIRSMQLSFSNVRSIKVPFTITDLPTVFPHSSGIRPFVYIGRISPQKNLDQLLKAYAQLDDLIKEEHPLVFYGAEDHLGFPNIGVLENSYLQKLEDLVSELNLSKFVTFKGFVERLKIQDELGNNYIFISPSTHSDENFGMAAYRALQTGVPCVLTAWGGHNEYAEAYPGQIHFLRPHLTNNGAQINPAEFTRMLLESTKTPNRLGHFRPRHFTLDNILDLLKVSLDASPVNKEKLKATPLALTIYNQQKLFEASNQIQQCFKSFDDPAFILFFEAYARTAT